ncbi:MAG: NTP transferase domain-containing protein [Methanobacteriota archaeon]|nr:MAG: NTP transferase domain-containing protein [Euryarchaeota archaeon]
MAGGKATRFKTKVEKALLEVGHKTLLQRSLETLSLKEVTKVLVATSPHTPHTAEKAAQLGVEVIETPGEGYHEDVVHLLKTYPQLLTLNVDVPFVTRAHVALLLKAFDGRSLAGVISASKVQGAPRENSLAMNDGGDEFAWVGLNIATPNPDTATFELDDPLLAVNINDEADLAAANALAIDRGL